jgi:hypothetical protein
VVREAAAIHALIRLSVTTSESKCLSYQLLVSARGGRYTSADTAKCCYRVSKCVSYQLLVPRRRYTSAH